MCRKIVCMRLSAAMGVIVLLTGVFIAFAEALWPDMSGRDADANGMLRVDYSHSSDGYILVRTKKTDRKIKIRVKHEEDVLTYDINSEGEFEILPLQYGSGKYTVTLYKNVSGKKYSEEGELSFWTSMGDKNRVFRYPNQYVMYTKDSPAVQAADEVCSGLKTDKEKYNALCKYIEKNFAYDYIKAVTATTSSIPDIDACFSRKMGICQDLSAMAVCFFRSQGIPAKLMIGYANKSYHAWVSVIMDGGEILYDPTAMLGGSNRNVKYTVERFY